MCRFPFFQGEDRKRRTQSGWQSTPTHFHKSPNSAEITQSKTNLPTYTPPKKRNSTKMFFSLTPTQGSSTLAQVASQQVFVQKDLHRFARPTLHASAVHQRQTAEQWQVLQVLKALKPEKKNGKAVSGHFDDLKKHIIYRLYRVSSFQSTVFKGGKVEIRF